jgi:hypothetical protein
MQGYDMHNQRIRQSMFSRELNMYWASDDYPMMTQMNTDASEGQLDIRVSWYWNQDHGQAGEGSFCCKSLQNMFINVFGPLAASSQVYTFRAMQYIWVKNDFFTT